MRFLIAIILHGKVSVSLLYWTAKIPNIIITTPIQSLEVNGSDKTADAIATPKKGFRKWKVEAFVPPIFIIR